MKETLQEINDILAAAQIDCDKCCSGNKTAGVRFRKKIKEAQSLLKELRALSLVNKTEV